MANCRTSPYITLRIDSIIWICNFRTAWLLITPGSEPRCPYLSCQATPRSLKRPSRGHFADVSLFSPSCRSFRSGGMQSSFQGRWFCGSRSMEHAGRKQVHFWSLSSSGLRQGARDVSRETASPRPNFEPPNHLGAAYKFGQHTAACSHRGSLAVFHVKHLRAVVKNVILGDKHAVKPRRRTVAGNIGSEH